MPDLFKDWVQSISEKTQDVYRDSGVRVDELDSEYPAFMINLALSQYQDTILAANMMNVRADYLTPKMQYDFLMNAVPKKRRFSKWAKGAKDARIELIKETFNYSQKKAEIASDLITDSDFEKIKEYMDQGGKK